MQGFGGIDKKSKTKTVKTKKCRKNVCAIWIWCSFFHFSIQKHEQSFFRMLSCLVAVVIGCVRAYDKSTHHYICTFRNMFIICGKRDVMVSLKLANLC